jgi:hypothetical protein
MTRLIVCALAALAFAASRPLAPVNIKIDFGEKSMDINWDSVPGAAGYNVYTRPDKKATTRTRINPILITSGPHFTYIWNMENGKRVRKVKGYSHLLSVTAVCSSGTSVIEGGFSQEKDNAYFEGFRNVTSWDKMARIVAKHQSIDTIPVPRHVNDEERFMAFIEGPGKMASTLIKKSIDPLQEGGCEPIATLLVTLLNEWGLYAYKVEGVFIREFHSFVVINVNGVEYVMDYAADQFLPDVSPVIFPRDYSFLDDKPRLAKAGKPVYQIGKIISPDQSSLSDKDDAALYRSILSQVLASKK